MMKNLVKKIRDDAYVVRLFLSAVVLFFRCLVGLEPKLTTELSDDAEVPQERPRQDKVHIDPMIMTVKDVFAHGRLTAQEFDFEQAKESMLRGAAYLRSNLVAMNPTIERLPVILFQYDHGRRISIEIVVDFVQSPEGVIPALSPEEEQKLRHFGRVGKCFQN